MKDSIKVLEYVICDTHLHNDKEFSKLLTKSVALSDLKKYNGVSDYDLLVLTQNWELANHDELASLEIAVAVLLDGRISRNDYCGLNLKSYQNAHAIAHYYHLEAISLCKKLLTDKDEKVSMAEVNSLSYLLSDRALGLFLEESKSSEHSAQMSEFKGLFQ